MKASFEAFLSGLVMKYSKEEVMKMSDSDINKAVAYSIGLDFFVGDCGGVFIISHVANQGCDKFDPCNVANDAMPIIISNLITLEGDKTPSGSSKWWNVISVCGNYFVEFRNNPLRGAMEVYLITEEEV